MNLSDEMRMWLNKQKFEVEEKIDKLQAELDFINERLEGKVTKVPRQYFHIQGQFNYVHGMDLLPPHYEYMKEYNEFLRRKNDE